MQHDIKRLWNSLEWKSVEYSKKKIKLAGSAIAKNNFSKISEDEAHKIVNNWRAAHAFPLQTFYVNCKRKSSGYNNAIAVQRLKRLDSIVNKLRRQPDMSIVRMQDLGGCRMIMESIDDVYDVIDKFEKSSIKHKLVKKNDYICTQKNQAIEVSI